MNIYLIARSTHIVAMMLTIVLVIAAEPLFLSAAYARSSAYVERLYHLAERVLKLAELTTAVGLLAAVTMVVRAGWNPFAPWLLATYGLLALMSVIGRVATSWRRQVQTTLQPAAGAATLAGLRELLGDRRALLARWAVIAIFLTIMLLMQHKPSFGL
jgi:hypothetical protein